MITDSMEGTYEAVGPVLKFCQLIQFLEVMHPMFGYTKGTIIIPFIQVGSSERVEFILLLSSWSCHSQELFFSYYLKLGYPLTHKKRIILCL